MKKLSILMIGLLLISGFVFADEHEVASIEDLEARVAALEGATAITASGSISFVFGGDLNDDTTDLPTFTITQTPTATVSLGTSDDAVSATMVLDLLALPGVATTLTGADDPDFTGEIVFDDEDDVYTQWGYIQDFITWYNANNSDSTDATKTGEMFDILSADDFDFAVTFPAESPYDADDFIVGATFDISLLSKAIVEGLSAVDGGLWYTLVEEIGTTSDANDIVLKSLDADEATFTPTQAEVGLEDAAVDLSDEFTFLGVGDGDTTDDPGDIFYGIVGSAFATIKGYIDAQFGANVEDHLAALLDEDVDETTGGVQDFAETYLADYADAAAFITALDGVNLTEYELMDTEDRVDVKNAVDEALEFLAVGNDLEALSVASVVTGAFVKSASFSIMGLGGVIDLTANMTGGHVGVDAGINLDRSGHYDDSAAPVKTYPSLGIALSAGVVEGLSAGVTVYSDNNGVKGIDETLDSWYTLLAEDSGNRDPIDPKLGLGVDLGYTAALSDDLSVGGTAKIGIYDLLGTPAFGWSINVPFSGFGANASLLLGSGLGMTHLYASADYTIMGITPTVGFRYAAVGASDVLAFVKSDYYSSGTAAVLDQGGMEIDGSVAVDLSEFLPFAASVSGGATYSMPTTLGAVLGWNASLSATPIEILTVTAAAGAVGIERGTVLANDVLTWSVGLSATPLAGLTATASIGQAWAAETASYAGVGYLAPAVGLSYTHGAATLTANYGTKYDQTDATGAYGTYSVGMSVKF